MVTATSTWYVLEEMPKHDAGIYWFSSNTSPLTAHWFSKVACTVLLLLLVNYTSPLVISCTASWIVFTAQPKQIPWTILTPAASFTFITEHSLVLFFSLLKLVVVVSHCHFSVELFLNGHLPIKRTNNPSPVSQFFTLSEAKVAIRLTAVNQATHNSSDHHFLLY